MLPDTDKLRSQLILEEGLRLMAYDDSTGYPVPVGGICHGKLTVGVGHNLDANPLTLSQRAAVGHDGRTQPITHANAIMILDDDIAIACAALDDELPWWNTLDEIRVRVMADLAFNMGVQRLLCFHNFLTYLQSGNYDSAADDLQDSVWYRQTGTRGMRLVAMVHTGEDYTA